MIYLAHRAFYAKFPGQEGVQYQPYDEVKDFESWPEPQRQLHLDDRIVVPVMGGRDASFTPAEVAQIREVLPMLKSIFERASGRPGEAGAAAPTAPLDDAFAPPTTVAEALEAGDAEISRRGHKSRR